MNRKIVGLVVSAVSAMAISLFATPSVSDAIVITTVRVTVGANSFCGGTNCAGGDIAEPAWTAGLVGGFNTASGPLVLTQSGGGSNVFNFDTSDGGAAGAGCTGCAVVIQINPGAGGVGGVFANNSGVAGSGLALANGNADTGGSIHNEALDYLLYGNSGPGGIALSVGYADNVHTGSCIDATTDCFPGTGSGSTTARFGTGTVLGTGTAAPAFVGTEPSDGHHCTGSTADCFDAGVLRIVDVPGGRVPEPSTLLLLGVGIMGLAAWGRRMRA